MLFDGWLSLLRTAIVGILAYAALVLFLRVSGKRTLSKMNAFDLIVTVALGSTLATVLLSSSVSLATGLLAFALLIGLQYAVTWLSVRSPAVHGVVKGEPAMLVHKGSLLRDAMRRERVTEGEILAALRSEGVPDLAQVEALVLETDSSFSVLTSPPHATGNPRDPDATGYNPSTLDSVSRRRARES
ncbi:DUF421 domain-containing protein [Rubrobacter aplysinae]|uniref:DUF421 domain-containing protein n=1 Tax=Rubrobacter aplysinae TaxID=909625 RepID=UPI00064C4A43|nr:YetF domain-containing protein [Rubrobacter aplysinae]